MGYFSPRILVNEVRDKFLNVEPQRRRIHRILAAGRAVGARFTFFVTASHVTPDNASILEEIVAEGHELGSHSFDHVNFMRLDREGAREQIGRSLEVLSRFADVRGFRAPYLRAPGAVLEACRDLGLVYSSSNPGTGFAEKNGVWDLPVTVPMDYEVVQLEGLTATRAIKERWLGFPGPGQVLLFHPWRLGSRRYADVLPSLLARAARWDVLASMPGDTGSCALTFDLDFIQTRQLYLHSIMHLFRSPHLR